MSPAKTMISANTVVCNAILQSSAPALLDKSLIVAEAMKSKSKQELKTLCGVSDNLATHVQELVRNFNNNITKGSMKSGYSFAALMYNGPGFQGLDASSLVNMTANIERSLHNHVRIISGMYGVLKPLDLIQEYRLCMDSKLTINNGGSTTKCLYDYWEDMIANAIVKDLCAQVSGYDSSVGPVYIVNCASQEYAKAVLPHLPADIGVSNVKKKNSSCQVKELRVIECTFLDGGSIKSVYAKRARGLMARYLALNYARDADVTELLKRFDLEGYKFQSKRSDDTTMVYDRSPKDIPPTKAQLKTKAGSSALESDTTKSGPAPTETKKRKAMSNAGKDKSKVAENTAESRKKKR